jgi:hypothetical protein
MSNYDLSMQFLEILATIGGIATLVLFYWWKKHEKPSSAIERRQFHLKVATERRQDERGKYAMLSR